MTEITPWITPCQEIECFMQGLQRRNPGQKEFHQAVREFVESVFLQAQVLFGPAKAANAGGVAVSGLEQSQNALRMSWNREEVDMRLQAIMRAIHHKCVVHGENNGFVNYVNGANIAGFLKVADAMLAYGMV